MTTVVLLKTEQERVLNYIRRNTRKTILIKRVREYWNVREDLECILFFKIRPDSQVSQIVSVSLVVKHLFLPESRILCTYNQILSLGKIPILKTWEGSLQKGNKVLLFKKSYLE